MDDARSPLTGRLPLRLVDLWGRDAGLLEVVVRRDHVTVWLDDRCVAVAGRDELRRWLTHPRRPLQVDDLTLTTEGGRIGLSVDRFPAYLLPEGFAGRLVAVV